MTGKVDRHNVLAPELAKQILLKSGDAAEALVICESVLFGVLIAQAGSQRLAIEWLEMMTARIVERLVPDAIMSPPFDHRNKQWPP